jgi:hypothetical protein
MSLHEFWTLLCLIPHSVFEEVAAAPRHDKLLEGFRPPRGWVLMLFGEWFPVRAVVLGALERHHGIRLERGDLTGILDKCARAALLEMGFDVSTL